LLYHIIERHDIKQKKEIEIQVSFVFFSLVVSFSLSLSQKFVIYIEYVYVFFCGDVAESLVGFQFVISIEVIRTGYINA
jgi:hypothetical protein